MNASLAQKGLEWMPTWERSVLDSVMNLHYLNQENYIPDSKTLIRVNKGMISSNVHIASKDSHFLTLLDIVQPFRLTDSMLIPNVQEWINKEHIFLAKSLIKSIYGEENAKNWGNYVRYLSKEEVEKNFNADTVICISLPPMYEEYYAKPYPYCQVLIIQKEERGCLPMYFLYDEEGKKNLDQHIIAMMSSLRYGEEKPLLRKLINEDVVFFVPNPQQKKQNIIR
jgi:hypothetical protein